MGQCRPKQGMLCFGNTPKNIIRVHFCIFCIFGRYLFSKMTATVDFPYSVNDGKLKLDGYNASHTFSHCLRIS